MGLGDCSVGKVLDARPEGLNSDPQTVLFQLCDPSSRRQKLEEMTDGQGKKKTNVANETSI